MIAAILLALCGPYDRISGVATYEPTIVMIAAHDQCHLSVMWWDAIRPMFAREGWRVLSRKDNSVPPNEPIYRIHHNGRWHTSRGWLLKAHLKRLIGIPTI